MEKNQKLNLETLKQNALTTKKKFLALYVSTNGKGIEDKENDFSRYVRGNMSDFNKRLTENKNKVSEEYLSDEFILLYNKQSKDSLNRFILRYVENTGINGPVIIIKKDKSDLDTNTHKWIGKKVLNKVDWLGFNIDW